MAHRNFEKNRRDRLKTSLDNLKALIPEDFLKQVSLRKQITKSVYNKRDMLII